MTVRFPNGQTIVYNAATFVMRSQDYSALYTKKDGQWVAQVPNAYIIESSPACRVYDALQQQPLEQLRKEVHILRRKVAGKRS